MTKGSPAKQKVVYLSCEKYVATATDYRQAFETLVAQKTTSDEPKAFGYYWAHKEAIALGKDIRLAAHSDPDLARELYRRMLQWRLARIDWHLLISKKQCPEAWNEQQTQRWRDAAQCGLILGDQSADTESLIQFIKQRGNLSQREYRMFLKAAYDNPRAKWRHPELDTFLMLIWPIVTRFSWTHGDVYEAAKKKFPDQSKYPFDAPHQLTKHCTKTLGLHTMNKPRTARPHPKGKPPLMQLALEMSTDAWLLRRVGLLAK